MRHEYEYDSSVGTVCIVLSVLSVLYFGIDGITFVCTIVPAHGHNWCALRVSPLSGTVRIRNRSGV